METFTCRVDNQGRIAIPAKLRKQAGMEAGSEALVFVEDGGIVVLTRENAIRQAQGILRRAIGDFRGSLVDDLIAERRREVEQEERERSGRRRKSA